MPHCCTPLTLNVFQCEETLKGGKSRITCRIGDLERERTIV